MHCQGAQLLEVFNHRYCRTREVKQRQSRTASVQKQAAHAHTQPMQPWQVHYWKSVLIDTHWGSTIDVLFQEAPAQEGKAQARFQAIVPMDCRMQAGSGTL